MERQQDKEVYGLALGNLANAYFCLSEYKNSIDCNEKVFLIKTFIKKFVFKEIRNSS